LNQWPGFVLTDEIKEKIIEIDDPNAPDIPKKDTKPPATIPPKP